MAEIVEKVKQRALLPFRNLSYAQRLTMALVLLITVVGMVAIIKWATQPEYVILASDLDPADAQDVVDELGSNNVPYKIVEGGRGIMVPRKKVYVWRMKLAAKNLPASTNLGYEIFDRKDIGVSEFVQKLNYRRALEGELARTIEAMSEVRSSRVHIVFPKDRLFKEDQKEPTASIFLSLRGRLSLTNQQIKGITLLVARSVEGLKTDNVTIVDSHGNVLTKNNSDDSFAGLHEGQLDMKNRIESYLEDKARSMLDRVLGSGNAIVRVTSDVDFRKFEKTNESYDPDKTVVLSEEIENQTVSDSASGGENGSEHTITNYQLAKSIEHEIDQGGNIKRLSVAVLVNGRLRDTTTTDGKKEKIYKPRSKEELAKLAALVRNAVGLNESRGDQLDIQNMPFEQQAWLDDVQPKTFEFLEKWAPLIEKGVIALIVLVSLFVIRSKFNKAKAFIFSPVNERQDVPSLKAGAGKKRMNGEEEDDLYQVVKTKFGGGNKLQETVIDFISTHPAKTANLIRSWMAEE
ncbi:MAG: flagellar M-ring protein FliF [Actinobacteria bacterium]|nr:flagellar M-ring protein FliF [Actinomycetota bacterium]